MSPNSGVKPYLTIDYVEQSVLDSEIQPSKQLALLDPLPQLEEALRRVEPKRVEPKVTTQSVGTSVSMRKDDPKKQKSPQQHTGAVQQDNAGSDADNHYRDFSPKYYVVHSKGFEFSLDGYRMKNVIFEDGVVTYDGGPSEIQNVYFVNCAFRFKPTGDWKRLSKSLFTRPTLDFSKPEAARTPSK